MKLILHAVLRLTALVIGLALCGCGSGQQSGRPDLDAIPDEELHGSSTKGMLYEFRAKVRKRGVQAAKAEVPVLLESFADVEQQPVGGHLDTYRQIAAKLQELQTTLAGSPTKEAVVKAAEEIGTLADKLPGTADPNPQVE